MSQEGRPGQGPEQLESRELLITDVELSEYRSGIPLSGWKSVASALQTFATGRTKAGRATQQDLEGHIERDGGAMGLGLYFLATARVDRNQFVDKMLQKAQSALRVMDHWERHYDYDGMGTPFFKTTVKITRLPKTKESYLLRLDAAFVGEEVEDGLAETLGIEQGLQWKSVKVKLAPVGRQFRINYDEVVQRLEPVLKDLKQPRGRGGVTGADIVRHILSTYSYAHHHEPYILGTRKGVEASLSQGKVGNRYDLESDREKRTSLWIAQSGILTGPVATEWRNPSVIIPPSFSITIQRKDKGYNRLPAIDPAMKATMNELASRVATSFNP